MVNTSTGMLAHLGGRAVEGGGGGGRTSSSSLPVVAVNGPCGLKYTCARRRAPWC